MRGRARDRAQARHRPASGRAPDRAAGAPVRLAGAIRGTAREPESIRRAGGAAGRSPAIQRPGRAPELVADPGGNRADGGL